MRKVLLLLFFLPILCFGQANVTGTVTYKSRAKDGNKIDVGALVYFVPIADLQQEEVALLDSIKLGIKSKYLYEKLYSNLHDKEQVIKLIGKEYIPYEKTLNLEFKFVPIYSKIKKGNYPTCLIDGLGKYEISIPEGTYYVVFKSSNKEIEYSTLFGNGLIDIHIETIKKDKYNIASNVFDIILAE